MPIALPQKCSPVTRCSSATSAGGDPGGFYTKDDYREIVAHAASRHMVLIPEIVDAVAGRAAVLGAGGIGRGRQMAAAMALGAAGVWCGSVWLTTDEAETHPVVKQKFLKAGSADTIRSRSRTGKPARQLRSAWTDAWDDPEGPGPLGMPLQNILTAEANARIARAHRKDLAFVPVGQMAM